MDVSKDFILLSFARSGVNFFQEYLKQTTDTYIGRTHTLTNIHKDKKVVGIIRKPRDSFISSIAMGAELFNGVLEEDSANIFLPSMIADYCKTVSWIRDNAHVYVDYNRLLNDPELTLGFVAEQLGLSFVFKKYDPAPLAQRDQNDFLVTSTNTKYYSKAIKLMDKYDLSAAEEVYTSALNKIQLMI